VTLMKIGNFVTVFPRHIWFGRFGGVPKARGSVAEEKLMDQEKAGRVDDRQVKKPPVGTAAWKANDRGAVCDGFNRLSCIKEEPLSQNTFSKLFVCELDFVYRLARYLSELPEEAADLVAETYAHACTFADRAEMANLRPRVCLFKILHDIIDQRHPAELSGVHGHRNIG
jgi:hypothetical protein